jgi:hypothetical protein
MMTTSDGLRVFVNAVAADVAHVAEGTSPEDSTRVSRLVASWSKLVDFLALGPAPELRQCPHCGAVGMRAATLCGTCWKKLVPPEPHPAGAR